MCWGDGEWGRQGGGLRSYIFPAFGFSQMYALCNASTVRFIVMVCVGHAHRTSSNQFRQVPLLLRESTSSTYCPTHFDTFSRGNSVGFGGGRWESRRVSLFDGIERDSLRLLAMSHCHRTAQPFSANLIYLSVVHSCVAPNSSRSLFKVKVEVRKCVKVKVKVNICKALT
jgi:hypothetical protein